MTNWTHSLKILKSDTHFKILCVYTKMETLTSVVWQFFNLFSEHQSPDSNLSENCFWGKDGVAIYYEKHFVPNMKALVVLLHGYGENTETYQELVEIFKEKQIGVCLVDHQGHGKSGGKRGYVRNFDCFVEDVQFFVSYIRDDLSERLSRIPFFLVGHSMGANIAIQVAHRDPTIWRGVYLSSPMIQLASNQSSSVTVFITQVVSHLIPKLIIPTFCLTHEKLRRVDSPVKSELPITVRMASNLVQACHEVQKLVKSVRFPFLVAIGLEDKLCSVTAMDEFYLHVQSADKQIRKYEGLYHELLAENDRQVLGDLIKYILDRI